MAKITRQYRIAEELESELTKKAARTGRSKTELVEAALYEYLFSDAGKQAEELAGIFLKKFDEKYNALFTRLRLGLRSADINSQVTLRAFNNFLLLQGYQEKQYIDYNKMGSPLVISAEKAIKEEIARHKQAKDDKRTG